MAVVLTLPSPHFSSFMVKFMLFHLICLLNIGAMEVLLLGHFLYAYRSRNIQGVIQQHDECW